MGGQSDNLAGPDLQKGVSATDVKEGATLLGHASGEAVILSRVDGKCHAMAATCSHYGGPLSEGLVVDGTVRCPWHHACFNLRSGQALRPPALNDLPCWRVDEVDGKVFVREKIEPAAPKPRKKSGHPESIAIIGAGAAGQVASETLRREGYAGRITMYDPVVSEPVDRPNLSKDYLAGNAQPEWIPLRGPEWFAEHDVSLARQEVHELDAKNRRLTLTDGSEPSFGAIIFAPGAEPIRLDLPGTGPKVLYLRTLADSDAIIAAATGGARRVAVLGASFIGLEVAASLRARGLEVHVAAPEARPLERVLGPELGDFVKSVHEEKGVTFHLGRTGKSLEKGHLVLDDGSKIAADFIVAGVGVRPRTKLAEAAGLRMEKGVVVNEYLETSAPGVFAAGDVARWPDPYTGQAIRVEHWVVAEDMGQAAARNALGARQRFDAVPFFWSAHYDVTIRYVGHAEKWDRTRVEGDPSSRDCSVSYVAGDKTLAVAAINRDRASLEAEARMERSIA